MEEVQDPWNSKKQPLRHRPLQSAALCVPALAALHPHPCPLGQLLFVKEMEDQRGQAGCTKVHSELVAYSLLRNSAPSFITAFLSKFMAGCKVVPVHDPGEKGEKGNRNSDLPDFLPIPANACTIWLSVCTWVRTWLLLPFC